MSGRFWLDGKHGGGSGFRFARGAFAGWGRRHLAFDALAVGFEETAEFLHGRQGDEVAGDEELLVHAGGGS